MFTLIDRTRPRSALSLVGRNISFLCHFIVYCFVRVHIQYLFGIAFIVLQIVCLFWPSTIFSKIINKFS